MSIPTLQGLQTALSGLMAEQEAIDTTGQNITNANTEGYSRQTAVLQANDPLRIAALSPTNGEGAQLGTGVSVATITRIRNTYLDAQYRTQNAGLGAASTQANELQQAQSAFDEPSSAGIATQLSAFWSAWGELADAPAGPTSEAAKVAVVSAGTQLAETLHAVSAQLQTIEAQAAQQYTTIAGPSGEVQSDASQIAQLNEQIKLSLQAKQQPNNLEDRRDLLLDKLSELGDVTVTKEANGTDTVSFGGAAKPLVEGSQVNWPQALTTTAGGKLGALLELAGPTGAIAKFQEALNGVAKTLADSVNEKNPGTPFFTGTTAATIAVAVKPSEVSAGAAGGNEIALAVAGLRGGAAEQGYAALIAQVGSDVKTAESNQANSQAVVTAIAGQRESVSGVSLDEEMTSLITFQRGYEASARALTSMDEMLDTLINHTGAVGL
jgi:flagellar hook-associated protein 1 FlgK